MHEAPPHGPRGPSAHARRGRQRGAFREPTDVEPTLTRLVFGLDWRRWLPHPLGPPGAVLRPASAAEVSAFLAEHGGAMVAPEAARSGFARLDPGPARERFTRFAMDAFVIEQGSGPAPRALGIFVGQAWDWSTYYLRHLALLPEARGFGAVVGVVELFSTTLGAHGIERLELDVSISHLAQLRRILGAGFYPMGTLHSERWGAMIHLVRFLSPPNEEVFLDQFSAGLRTAGSPADGAPCHEGQPQGPTEE